MSTINQFRVISGHDQRLSNWQIGKLVIRKMREEGTLWHSVALAVTAVALSVFIIFCAMKSLNNISDAHRKLAEGNWVVNTYLYGRLIDSHPFSQRDVTQIYVGTGFALCIALPLLALIPFAFLDSIKQNINTAHRKVCDYGTVPLPMES